MATLSTIRAAIKTKLQGVANIGVVHDYERFASRESDFQTLYKDTVSGRILGWNFYREATLEEELSIGDVRRVHTWRIHGFMGLDDADATGKTFEDLIEAIATAFRADPTLGGVVLANKDLDDEFGQVGIQVDQVDTVMFAGVLCHRARLRLLTETTENV